MYRYLLTFGFTILVVALYNSINIQLFTLDLPKTTRESLFRLFKDSTPDTTIMLLNIGRHNPASLASKIDSLMALEPKIIGVNLCHYDHVPHELIASYSSHPTVVIANCKENTRGSQSRIIDYGNRVTHFRSDQNDYFEFNIVDFNGNGNEVERINYSRTNETLYQHELGDLRSFRPGSIKDKVILLGYMGDYLNYYNPDTLYFYTNTRITPLNPYYDDDEYILPDMYDIVISANILKTISEGSFIKEINPFMRVLMLLLFSLATVSILTYGRTRWLLVNLIVATVLFIVFTATASLLIVYAFDSGYFLALDEVPILLLLVTSFTTLLNIKGKNQAVKPG